MAIYHFSVQIISRGAGKSVLAAAAYRSGEKLQDDYYGLVHDYSRKQNIVHKEVLLPVNAPEVYCDREVLWNAVEASEKAKNAQLAREIELAIPTEISEQERASFVRDFCQKTFVEKGMCADICIHDKKDGNPHAHVMLTMRAFEKNGTWAPKSKKEYILDKDGKKIYDRKKRQYKCRKVNTTNWNDRCKVEEWRADFAAYVNEELEKRGISERVDHRSFERQGSDFLPTTHMGVDATHMEKKGIATEVGDYNREVKEHNRQLFIVRQIIAKLQQKLECFSLLFQHRKLSDEAVQEQYQIALTKLQPVQKRLKEVEKRINFINQALEHCATYKTNARYYSLWKSAKNPDKYRSKHEVEIAMYEGAKWWIDKYYHGKIPNVQKRKTELVKLTAEKYNLMQEYQKTKASVEESRKMVLERQINVRNGNERNNDTRHNQKQGDWIR